MRGPGDHPANRRRAVPTRERAGTFSAVVLVAGGAVVVAACGGARASPPSAARVTSPYLSPSATTPSGAAAPRATGAGAQPVGTKTTLTYCNPNGVPQTLDLYQPSAAPQAPVPVVVWVHGGGWSAGTSSFSLSSVTGQVESAVVHHGWLFASINYRLAPRYQWPAQIEDAKCAIRFLRADAASYHIDPGHIGAMGSSAGGHLVSLLGLAGPAAGFDVDQYVQEPSAVEAVVDQFGPADLTSSDWAASPAAERVSPLVFGVPFGQASPVLTAASPVTYVAPGAPPFLVQQGVEDTTVPPDQSELLVQRLEAAGDSATLQLVQNAGHGFKPTGAGPVSPSPTALAQQAADFFFEELGR